MGEPRERLGRDRVHLVALDEKGAHLGVAERAELDHLAARDDGRQHALQPVGDEEEHHVGRRLLQALEELVRGFPVHVLDLGDDPHAMRGRERLEAEVADDRLDLLDAPHVALALEDVQVGVHSASRALALGAGAAVAAARDQHGAELARERRLGEALRPGQQVGVTQRAVAQRAREERLGLSLSRDRLEHGALSRRAAGRRRPRPPGRRPRRRRPRGPRRGSRRRGGRARASGARGPRTRPPPAAGTPGPRPRYGRRARLPRRRGRARRRGRRRRPASGRAAGPGGPAR